MSVVIETTIGDITVDLFTDERPVACLNFIKLCKLKYYNYNLFHTVEQGFIAQTGDPTGAGQGGSSVWGLVEGGHKRFFEAEGLPKIYHNSAGLLSLVSAGKNLVGSQFFFTLGANLNSLDGVHCVIGEVVEGHEILRKLNESIVDDRFRPYQDIRITHTVILEDPFADPRGFQVPSRSPSPSAERLQHGRIAADEDIDDTDGKSMQEIQEMLADREAKARATILEIVGDIPDAEMAPPENVLFVCKLNQVTTDDDLEIIFSRFGKVKCCEVIRDKKSGDSLQYAFVEFEEQKSCEAAYFKMDNVLIDDRRIHVDFSQSVAKVKWRGKGRGVEGPDGRLDFNNLKEEAGGGGGRNRNRDEGARNERRRKGSEDHSKRFDQRSRMTSEERRSARETRHREQEAQRSTRGGRRSVSKTRDDFRSFSRTDNSRQHDDERRNYRREEERREVPRRREEERKEVSRRHEEERREVSRRHDEKRCYSRSRSRDPVRRRSPERRLSTDRRRPDRRISPTERRRQCDGTPPPPQARRTRPQEDLGKRESSREKIKTNVQKDKLNRKKDDSKKKSKKSKHVSSESESSSSDSSSTSSSDSSSSRDNDRRRKKKSKKTKSKSKKSKKSSHNRKK